MLPMGNTSRQYIRQVTCLLNVQTQNTVLKRISVTDIYVTVQLLIRKKTLKNKAAATAKRENLFNISSS